MTQDREQINKIAELNAIFLSLNDRGQDGALTILRSLEFAQSVMKQKDQPDKSSKSRPR